MSNAVMSAARTANHVFVLVQPDIFVHGHMTFIGTYSIAPEFLTGPHHTPVHVD